MQIDVLKLMPPERQCIERTCRVTWIKTCTNLSWSSVLCFLPPAFFFGLILISYISWWVKNQISKLSFPLMCFDCVTEQEQQLESISTGALTCWYHWSPGRPPAVLQLLLEVCKGPCASAQKEQNCVCSSWILLDCQNLSQDADLGLPLQFPADICCYSNCCLQWLLLLLWRNEIFSTEEWTEMRAFPHPFTTLLWWYFSHILFSIGSHKKRCLDFKYRPFPKALFQLS